ncbi:glutamate ABC transporter substrate-binding protein [Paenibacillus aurantius]|uniref:Glutamate ABC transporter substrate-binding protein n=1 Tax=Paenibacillus aurantius TaxID=2918900 RepID=A0AA96REH1_9BACL|nr:glutamate ABC transporter substrate-binding protein [Paenibacillus aurantius]WNQ10872.1 glutamate ABC transporter substrate-binding protein [Paenibacillus aurantius]
MKRSKGWLSLVMVLTLVLLALAGCGNKDNAGGTSGSGSPSPAGSPSGGSGGGGSAASGKALDGIKKRGKLVVGVKYDTKLFGLKDPASGKVEGFDVDISKAIAKKLLGDENKIELKEVTSKTRINMLNNDEIDMIVATMTINEERKKEVDFSDIYFNAGQSLLVKKGSPIKSIKDVTKDTKVLSQKGATSVKNIEEKVPGLRVQQFDNYQDAFTALKSGQGDVLTTDNAILYGMMKQDPNFEVVGEPFTEEPYGIAVKKDTPDLVKFINDTLKELKSSGEYDKIYTKWIGEAPKK